MKNEYEKPTAKVIEVKLSNCIAGSIGIPDNPDNQSHNINIPTGKSQNNVIDGNTSFERW